MILKLLALVLFVIQVSTAYEDPAVVCTNTSDHLNLVQYYSNVQSLLTSLLPVDAGISGFSNRSLGSHENRAYAIAQCRGDLYPDQCNDCLRKASFIIQTKCRISTKAVLWLKNDECMIHYEHRHFFGEWDGMPLRVLQSYELLNSSGLSRENFVRLAAQAAFSNPMMFATGEINLNPSLRIYLLVQCTKDLSPVSCFNCLSKASETLETHSKGRQGAVVLLDSCTIKYDVQKFYNERHSKPSKRKHVIVLISTAIGSALLGAAVATTVTTYVHALRRRKGKQT